MVQLFLYFVLYSKFQLSKNDDERKCENKYKMLPLVPKKLRKLFKVAIKKQGNKT